MEKELKKINEFIREFQGKYFQKISEKDWKRKVNQNKVFTLMVYSEDVLIGLAFLYVIESLTRKALVIEDIIIDKKFRKKGYGTVLLKDIIKCAKGLKVDCVDVCFRKTNKTAQRMYSKLGFKSRKNIAYRLWL